MLTPCILSDVLAEFGKSEGAAYQVAVEVNDTIELVSARSSFEW